MTRPAATVTNHATSQNASEATSVVDAALVTRRSIRAFLPTPVPRADIEAILEVASRAPSGTNTQPWKVYVVTGNSLARVSQALLEAYDHPERDTLYREEYPYYPREWVSPYIDRRRKIGWDLYGLLGIEKGDKARMHEQHAQNYRFFGAPVGLFFTISRVMERGSWLDYGMFMQAIMTAARGRGLDTCPQAAFTPFHQVIAAQLDLPPTSNWCAACRSASQTKTRWSTRCAPNGNRSNDSRGFWIERLAIKRPVVQARPTSTKESNNENIAPPFLIVGRERRLIAHDFARGIRRRRERTQ